MCGIAVFLGPRDHPLYRRRSRLMEGLRHRGPDDTAEREISLAGGRVLWLGHTRLSILDLSEAARQPMADPVTGSLLVYNGEIYNYRELAENLRTKGVKLHSTGDTEVILAAYRIWKIEALRHLRGMYSFVLWDAQEEKLWCSRDPFGIKPLYAHRSGAAWFFCSEIRPILAARDEPVRIHPKARYEYFTFGSPHGPETIVEGIETLVPGEARALSADGSVAASQVHALPAHEKPEESYTDEALHKKVRHAFAAAVERHMLSDVPVGLFLSGGLDSSMIAAVLAEDLGKKPECYTVGFAGKESAWDESHFARQVAARWGLPHIEVRLTQEEVLGQIDAGLGAMDQPTIDGINTYIVSGAFHRSGGKVALSGLGSDELFGGYERLQRLPEIHQVCALPHALRRLLAAAIPGGNPFSKRARLKRLLELRHPDTVAVYQALREVWPPAILGELFTQVYQPRPTQSAGQAREIPPATCDGVTRLEFAYYLPDVLLRDADVMGMAHSLEIRVPYLDYDFVRAVRSLPDWARFTGAFPKSILVESRLRSLGREFLHRPKTGFMLPIGLWMRGPLKKTVFTLLNDRDLHAQAGLRSESITAWSDRFFRDDALPWSRLWAIIVYLDWVKRHNATAE